MSPRARRAALGAVTLGGPALVVLALALRGGATGPTVPLTLWIAAVAVGSGLALAPRDGRQWSPRAVLQVVALALLATPLAVVWELVRTEATVLEPLLAQTGLRTVLDALRVLPALLPAAVVPLPGAVLLALAAFRLLDLLLSSFDLYNPALALLAVPLIAAPAEALLAHRGPDRSRRTLAAAGALLGLGATISEWLALPGAEASVAGWLAALIGWLISGALAGWLAGWLRDRLRAAVAARRADRLTAGGEEPE